MKRCVRCGLSVEEKEWNCGACGFAPADDNGVLVFSPHLLSADNAFDIESFPAMDRIPRDHFWYQPRNKLINWVISTYFPEANSFFEMGCATGTVLRAVAEAMPNAYICGGDIFIQGLHFAKARLAERADILQLDCFNLPFRDNFDVAGSFDVIEHIDDDAGAVAELSRAVKPGGGIVIVVPRHMFLWSKTDELAAHKRRYSRRGFEAVLNKAGLEVIRIMTFGTITVPVQYLSRRILPQPDGTAADPLELEVNPIINAVLKILMKIDQVPIRMGVNYPFGASLLGVCRRPSR